MPATAKGATGLTESAKKGISRAAPTANGGTGVLAPESVRIVIIARDKIYCRVLKDAAVTCGLCLEVCSYQRTVSGMDALRATVADLAVLDADMPDIDGLDYIPEIIESRLARRTVIVSSRHDEHALIGLSTLRWDSWIDLSTVESAELSAAFAEVWQGRRFISQSVKDARRALRDRADLMLTSREALVLSILGEGLDNEEAAERLKVCPSTIRTQRARIMSKLDVHQVGHLVLRAQTLGYTRLTEHGALHPGFERQLRASDRTNFVPDRNPRLRNFA